PQPRSGPSRCGGAPDRYRGCESGGPWASLIDRRAPAAKRRHGGCPNLPNRVHGCRLLQQGRRDSHVIEFPDSATFATAFADGRFLAAAAAGTAGLVRGFSGFGGALIYMPLITAIYEPRIAAVTLLLVDFLSSTPFAMFELRRCTWREVWPISIAMAVTVPLGTYLLVVLDPIVLRWIIAILVIGLVAILVSGWRYRGPSSLPITTGIGMIAGVGAGAAQIAGPPVILYWLSRGNNAVTLRANLMVFFLFCGVMLI